MKHTPSDKARKFSDAENALFGMTASQRPENTGAILATSVVALRQCFRQWLVDARPTQDVADRAAERVAELLKRDVREMGRG